MVSGEGTGTRAARVLLLGVVVIALLGVFALWSTRLNDPYTGRHDNVTAYVHIAARNYDHYGPLALHLIPITNVDDRADVGLTYYHHNPQLMSVTAFITYSLVGDHPLSIRLAPVFLTLIAAALVFRLARLGYGARVAALSLVLFVSTPMIAFYGAMACHEEMVLPMLLWLGIAYVGYLQQPTPRRLALVGLVALLSMWSAWTTLFFVFGLGLHVLLLGHHRVQVLVVLGTALALALGLWAAYSSAEMPGFLEGLKDSFLTRTNNKGAPPWNGPVDYVWQMVWNRARIRYTEALLVLAALGSLVVVRRWPGRAPEKRWVDGLVGVWLLTGTLYVAILRQASFAHDYLTYYYAPALVILGAVALAYLWRLARGASAGWLRGAARIALLLLLLAALVLSDARWIRALYREHNDFPVQLGPEIQARVPPGTVIWTPLDWSPAIWYYGQREVVHRAFAVEELPPDAVGLICEQAVIPTARYGGDLVRVGEWTCEFVAP